MQLRAVEMRNELFDTLRSRQ